MLRLQGIAVSSGIAIGEAMVLGRETFDVPDRLIEGTAVDREIERFRGALAAAVEELSRQRDAVIRELGQRSGSIFNAHLEILQDTKLREDMESLIRERHYAPERAVSRVLRRYADVFRRLPNPNFAERVNDVYDIEKLLLRSLLGQPHSEVFQLHSPVVVLAANLTPSETARLDRKLVRGFVTETGGPGGHTAIVAQGLGIPAVVGTGPFLGEVSGGDTVIVDGDRGLVIVNPDGVTLHEYSEQYRAIESLQAELRDIRGLPAETLDGTRIHLVGNIEFPQEAEACLEQGAEGIGLYRTEFLYLGRATLPSEEEHYQAYLQVIQTMGDRPVTIRTFDLGADKIPHDWLPRQMGWDSESNPCLGLRSIRLALRHLPMFRSQLRAILRASAVGRVEIMFPLIATLAELRQAKFVVADVMEELAEAGIPFRREIPIGMMVEVPSTAIMLERYLPEVDFISIGTNDLLQYTLAVDRTNRNVVSLYSSADPALIRLLSQTIRTAQERGVPVGLCGQMSSSPIYTMLLIGLGLRNFSVTAGAIPEVKKVCRSVTVAQCRDVANHVMEMENARDIRAYLREELVKILPEFSRLP